MHPKRKSVVRSRLGTRNLQIRTLAEAINKIFVVTFGAAVYDENLEQCIPAAEKILESVPDYLKSTQKI